MYVSTERLSARILVLLLLIEALVLFAVVVAVLFINLSMPLAAFLPLFLVLAGLLWQAVLLTMFMAKTSKSKEPSDIMFGN